MSVGDVPLQNFPFRILPARSSLAGKYFPFVGTIVATGHVIFIQNLIPVVYSYSCCFYNPLILIQVMTYVQCHNFIYSPGPSHYFIESGRVNNSDTFPYFTWLMIPGKILLRWNIRFDWSGIFIYLKHNTSRFLIYMFESPIGFIHFPSFMEKRGGCVSI
jgi:hypothetical protein